MHIKSKFFIYSKNNNHALLKVCYIVDTAFGMRFRLLQIAAKFIITTMGVCLGDGPWVEQMMWQFKKFYDSYTKLIWKNSATNE